jgi:ribosomal-protein-alanine N-acetyltransferase
MFFSTPIVTDRLTIQQAALSDFDRFFAMSIDPEVMRYIGDGSVFHWSTAVALEKYKERIARQDASDLGNWSVYQSNTNGYVGWCGLSFSKFLGHVELGYRYCRDSWGAGLATEAASAILEEIYQISDLDDILACTHPDNTASIRVLEKLGFIYIYSKHSRPIARDIFVYRVDRNLFVPVHKD